MNEKEIQKVLSNPVMDPVVRKIAESYLRVYEDRNEMAEELNRVTSEHNQMYGIFVGVIRQLGNKFVLKKENMPQFELQQYKVRWEDAPEDEALLLEVKHFTD
jgi:hypothetical protein